MLYTNGETELPKALACYAATPGTSTTGLCQLLNIQSTSLGSMLIKLSGTATAFHTGGTGSVKWLVSRGG